MQLIHKKHREKRVKKKKKKRQRSSHTSVVLLLLVIVAELPLTLCRHSTLCLHHLLCLTRATLEPLSGIVALEVGSRVDTRSVEIAERVVTLGYGAHKSRILDLV